MPLHEFYKELVYTQPVLNRKHLGWTALRGAARDATLLLMHGQTNFVRMVRRFNSVFNPNLQLSDHAREVPKCRSALPDDTARSVD